MRVLSGPEYVGGNFCHHRVILPSTVDSTGPRVLLLCNCESNDRHVCCYFREGLRLSEIDPLKIMQSGLGFWQAKCLLSAIELNVFTELGKGPRTRKAIGEALGLHPKGIPDFLDGLVAMKFIERNGDGEEAIYRNSEGAGRFLDRNSSEYMAGYLEMANSRLFPFWVGLTDTLRTGKPQNEVKGSGPQIFDELYRDPDRLEQYVNAMSGIGTSNFQSLRSRV